MLEPQPDPPVCILGLGLIGGSLMRAAAAAGRTVWGYNRSSQAVDDASEAGYDVGTRLDAALDRASREDALIVIAVPMPAVDPVLQAIAQRAPMCSITDVVSVKAAVAEAVRSRGLTARYVGGHPMAGTSASGWAASDGNLFRGAVWVVSVDDEVDAQVWTQVASLALATGAVIVPATSVEHDAAAARISHLPHLLAETLAAVGAGGGPLALGLAAGSFRDGTRVAGSAPGLVEAMCDANSEALVGALDEALALLTAARAQLADAGSTHDLVENGHAARRAYETQERWNITGILPGAPGWHAALRDAGNRGGVITALD